MSLEVRYDDLIKTGKEIIGLSDSIDEIIIKLTEIIEKINIYWTGNDATKYVQVINEQYIHGLYKLQEMIKDNGIYLEGIAQIYETIDNNCAILAKRNDIDGNY